MAEQLHAQMATLLALYDLGGGRRAVDTEDIAMRAAQVAPKLFRWKKYPEQIDLEAVRLGLKGNKAHSPPYVTGSIRTGWQLTVDGLRQCEGLRVTAGSDLHAEAQRLRLSKAFQTW